MKNQLIYKPEALKELERLPLSERKKVVKKLEILSENPLVGKHLKGEFKGAYTLRAWPYRIIYEFSQNKITVRNILHRQSAYN